MKETILPLNQHKTLEVHTTTGASHTLDGRGENLVVKSEVGALVMIIEDEIPRLLTITASGFESFEHPDWSFNDHGEFCYFYGTEQVRVIIPWKATGILDRPEHIMDAIVLDEDMVKFIWNAYCWGMEVVGAPIFNLDQPQNFAEVISDLSDTRAEVECLNESNAMRLKVVRRLQKVLTRGPAQALNGILKCRDESVQTLGQQLVDELRGIFNDAVVGPDDWTPQGGWFVTSEERLTR